MESHTDHAHHDDHHTTTFGYLMVFAALMVGTLLTVAAARWGHAHGWSKGFSATVALAIAVTKASLVLYFFMHVRESPKIIGLVAVGGFVWLSLLFIFTFNDYASRDRQAEQALRWDKQYNEPALPPPRY